MLYVNRDEVIDVDSDSTKNTVEKNVASAEAQVDLDAFWPNVQKDVKRIKQVDAKNQVLPLARIKKIMKLDENAKMIAAEAPLLFAKAAEIFIQELTLRAWIHTADSKRRTLQRNDIAAAISNYDQFDFLIDIVPREEIKTTTTRKEVETPKAEPSTSVLSTDQVQYYLHLAQQHQQALQNTSTTQNIVNQTIPVSNNAGTSVTIAAPQNILLTTANSGAGPTTTNVQSTVINNIQAPQQQIQLLQQVVTPNGEITHVPVTITPNQLNMLRMQMQGNSVNTSQPQQVIIPTMQQQPQIVQVTGGQQQNAVGPPTSTIYLNTTQTSVGDHNKQSNIGNNFRTNC